MVETSGPVADRPTVAGPLLDLHEGNSDRGSVGCPRWPSHLWLRSSLGELVQGRCRGPNRCEYCARLAAVENAEMLALDGVHGTAPRWWAVLTTASVEHRQGAYRSWWEVAKRRAGCETARLLEFTTGYGPRSGGLRRPHWNVLLKGQEHQARGLLDGWRAVSGSSQGYVGAIDDSGGLLRYLALHFQKESQKPPEWWKGQRLTISKGYLWTGTAAAREAARESLRRKRELWRAERRGFVGESVLEEAERILELNASATWELVKRTAAISVG